MSQLHVLVNLHGPRRVYVPGDELSGEVRILSAGDPELKAAELSVIWMTEGKGDEDLGTHFFERIPGDNGTAVDWRLPRSFGTRLPNSPLSYRGRIVKIRWCVRVRVFLVKGKEIVVDEPFLLGRVPAPVITPTR